MKVYKKNLPKGVKKQFGRVKGVKVKFIPKNKKLNNVDLFSFFNYSKNLSILVFKTTDILYNVSIEQPIFPFLNSSLLVKS